jgi:hypothetical protein
MIELPNTVFDEATDGLVPIVPGTYPAHVQGFEGKTLDTKVGSQKVFNVTFQVADEAKNITVNRMSPDGDGGLEQVVDDKGKPAEISAEYLSGKRFNSTGIWLTPEPPQGEGWRNRRYKEFFSNLGVVFPTDGNGKIMLAEVEETDVVGYPCLVKVDREQYEKDGETRYAWKVFNVYPWKDGQKLSSEELGSDVPF